MGSLFSEFLSCFEWREVGGLSRSFSQSLQVFQVGGRRRSHHRDCGKGNSLVRLITAVWEVLCTWRSPGRHRRWRRGSLSARRWSSSGPPEPGACEGERREVQVRHNGAASTTLSTVANVWGFFLHCSNYNRKSQETVLRSFQWEGPVSGPYAENVGALQYQLEAGIQAFFWNWKSWETTVRHWML